MPPPVLFGRRRNMPGANRLPSRTRKRGKGTPRVPFGGTVTDMDRLYTRLRRAKVAESPRSSLAVPSVRACRGVRRRSMKGRGRQEVRAASAGSREGRYSGMQASRLPPCSAAKPDIRSPTVVPELIGQGPGQVLDDPAIVGVGVRRQVAGAAGGL